MASAITLQQGISVSSCCSSFFPSFALLLLSLAITHSQVTHKEDCCRRRIQSSSKPRRTSSKNDLEQLNNNRAPCTCTSHAHFRYQLVRIDPRCQAHAVLRCPSTAGWYFLLSVDRPQARHAAAALGPPSTARSLTRSRPWRG